MVRAAPAPRVIVLAGPNGAGKSTAAAHLLPEAMEFVNADEVAKTLPGYPSQAADLLAARLVLAQMDRLEESRTDFAVETTLASRSLAVRIARLIGLGYEFRLIFIWTPNANLSVARVAERVRAGGHPIPEATIRRRYQAGLSNFFTLYQPLATQWGMYETSRAGPPRLIAKGGSGVDTRVVEQALWKLVQKGSKYE